MTKILVFTSGRRESVRIQGHKHQAWFRTHILKTHSSQQKSNTLNHSQPLTLVHPLPAPPTTQPPPPPQNNNNNNKHAN